MKITIERFVVGGQGSPSPSARYLVTYDQPPGDIPGLVNGTFNTSWQTSRANALTYIGTITEIPGP
jgi:hypothetical protein